MQTLVGEFPCLPIKDSASLGSEMDILYHIKEVFSFKVFLLKTRMDFESYRCLFVFCADDILFFLFYAIHILNYISKECTLRNTCLLGRNPTWSWNTSTVGFCWLVFYLNFCVDIHKRKRMVCIFFCVLLSFSAS